LKLFISADMEGVAGVARDEQTDPAGRDYGLARRLMTLEVNAAIEGSLEAGVQEIVVSDGHWFGTNLLPDELHPVAELLSGYPRRLYMAEGMGPGFDAAFFVGYHASAGIRDAVLDHSGADPRLVAEVRLNGARQSEGSLNGYLCGYFDCPVALFTGDAAAVSEMHGFRLEVEGVVVKEGLAQQASRSLHPEIARQRIRAGARRALERLDNIAPMRLEGGIELQVDFLRTAMADSCERVPGVRRVGARSVAYAGDDYVQIYKLYLAMIDLAQAATS
jgi:D-amino peptidase